MAMKPSRFFVWIIFGLMMVGMVGFGTTNFGNNARSVGTVGDTEIDVNTYFRELSATLRSFQAATGQNLPMAQAEAFGLTNQALERVISAAALDNEVARLGIGVSDAELRQQLMLMRDFQGVSGDFDPEAYEFVLQQNGLTPSEFEANLRRDLARAILQAAITRGAKTAPVFTETLFAHAREARDFSWAKLDLAALETQPEDPSEAELTEFHQAHPADYTLPEIKHVTYVWLKPESLLHMVEVPEADLRAMYNARSAHFNQPERRLVERLVFATSAEAEAAAAAITAGETDFATLAEARGLALSDIDLGDVTRADLGDAAEVVFALTEPGITGPVMTNLGPALFRVNAILAAQVTPFEAVRDVLHAEFAGDQTRRLILEQVHDLDDQLAGGATLEELAGNTEGMELASKAWQAGDAVGISAYDGFREAILASQEGDFPELLTLADGGLFALRLDRSDAPRLQELDEVRAEVSEAWLHQERLVLLTEQARAMLPALTEGGESLSSLGLTEISESGQTRGALIDGAPPQMLSEVFSMVPGDWRVLEDIDGVVLLHLEQVAAADQTSAEAIAAKAAFAGQMSQEIALDIEAAFSRALQIEAGITLDQAVIQAVHRQFP